jgi:hypothetical protein
MEIESEHENRSADAIDSSVVVSGDTDENEASPSPSPATVVNSAVVDTEEVIILLNCKLLAMQPNKSLTRIKHHFYC